MWLSYRNSDTEAICKNVWWISSTQIIRKFRAIPKTFGPGCKLCGKDEPLLMLMKLHQGMFTEDIVDRFDI